MSSRKVTDTQHIYYARFELNDDITNLQLQYSPEEIGYYLIFKAMYIYHKGKIPVDKLCQYCRVFENQEKFIAFCKKNFEKKGNFFFEKKFEKKIKSILEISKKASNSASSKGKANAKRTQSERFANNVIVNVNDNKNKKEVKNKFNEFWELYAHKRDEANAEKAFIKALKIANFEKIMHGVKQFVVNRGNDPQYWKLAATWLNGQCWNDEYKTASNERREEMSDKEVRAMKYTRAKHELAKKLHKRAENLTAEELEQIVTEP